MLWRGQLTVLNGIFLLVGYIGYLVLCFKTRSTKLETRSGSLQLNTLSEFEAQRSAYARPSAQDAVEYGVHNGSVDDIELARFDGDGLGGEKASLKSSPAPFTSGGGGNGLHSGSNNNSNNPSYSVYGAGMTNTSTSSTDGVVRAGAVVPRSTQADLRKGAAGLTNSAPNSPVRQQSGALSNPASPRRQSMGGELQDLPLHSPRSASAAAGLVVDNNNMNIGDGIVSNSGLQRSFSGGGGGANGSKLLSYQHQQQHHSNPTSSITTSTSNRIVEMTSFSDVVRSIPTSLEEMLHLHNKTGLHKYISIFFAPLVLFLHATMPAMYPGSFTMVYGSILAVVAPGFALLITPLGPSNIGYFAFSVAWLLSTVGIVALLLTIQPVSSLAALQASPRSIYVVSPTGGFSPTAASGGGLGANFKAALFASRPRRNPVFALMAFLQCILWLNTAADELVALFEAGGRLLNVRQDVLGATVLAWGETGNFFLLQCLFFINKK